MEQRGSLLKPAGGGEPLQAESGSLPLYLIWIGSGSCGAVAYLLTSRVRIYARDHNSFSWACSSAVHNCPVKAFEVKRRVNPLWFNGKSNASLCRSELVTCSLIGSIYSDAPSLTHTHTLPSFANLNGFSSCSRLRSEECLHRALSNTKDICSAYDSSLSKTWEACCSLLISPKKQKLDFLNWCHGLVRSRGEREQTLVMVVLIQLTLHFS